MTEWRALDWLPDYEISEHGDVRRCRAVCNYPAGRVLRPGKSKRTGYLIFVLMIDRKRKTFLAHRLACEAFHGPPPFEGACVAHGDGTRDNNHYTNLRWATRKENCADQILHGTRRRAETHYNARLTWADVRTIRAEYTGKRGEMKALAARFGVSAPSIGGIIHGRKWRESLVV